MQDFIYYASDYFPLLSQLIAKPFYLSSCWYHVTDFEYRWKFNVGHEEIYKRGIMVQEELSWLVFRKVNFMYLAQARWSLEN